MFRSFTWVLVGCVVSGSLASTAGAQGRSEAARAAARDRVTSRTADRIARQPNPRSSQTARDNITRRDERRFERPERPDHPERPDRPEVTQRRDFELSPRDNALRSQLAQVDRLRDQALLTGNEALLDRANELESQIQARFQQPASPTAATLSHEPEQFGPRAERDFERGLGRATSRQVRGLEPLPDVEIGAPGFGRRTAAERRYLRGEEPRGPWDALYRPMDPAPSTDPSTPVDPTTVTDPAPVVDPNLVTEPPAVVEPLPPIEPTLTP